MVNRLFITAKQAKRGISSSGRAFGSQSKGSGFESHMLHFYRMIASNRILIFLKIKKLSKIKPDKV